MRKGNKAALAAALGISRTHLYYVSRKDTKDWELKVRIEEVLREHHSYGSRSIRDALKINRKRIQRVMRKFGLKPYRRRGKKWRKKKKISVIYANPLTTTMPAYPHHVWAADFTEVWFEGRWVYIVTVSKQLWTDSVPQPVPVELMRSS